MRSSDPLSNSHQGRPPTVDQSSYASLYRRDRENPGFRSILDEFTPDSGPRETPRSKGEVSEIAFEELKSYVTQWAGLGWRVQALAAQVPPGARPYLEAQFLVHRLELETNLFVRAAEALANTLKRVQSLSA